MTMSYTGFVRASSAGILGAAGATLGRAAQLPSLGSTASSATLASRVLLLIGMVGCNLAGSIAYVSALANNTSSMAVTAVSNTANILAAGGLSYLVLGEAMSLQWLVGASCVSAGVALIIASRQPAAADQKLE
ncbi:hypothetical protein V8C86DRAFT_2451446 [Haematococcus lacustris]